MNIKEAEKASGVSARNIRFYEQKGLLTPNRNKGNDYREYSDGDIRRLQLIRALRMVDMPLEQIREVVDGEVSLHDAAAAQKEKLEDQIKHLKVVIKFCGELSETKPENVKEVLERMDKPENKKIFSKEWRTDYAEMLKKIWLFTRWVLAVLALILIVAVMSFEYFCAMAVPSWIDVEWYYLALGMAFVFGRESAAFILLAFTAGAVMLVPCYGEEKEIRRFIIRPIIAVLAVCVVSNPAIDYNDVIEDEIWDNHVETYTQEVSHFLDTADEVVLYEDYSQYYSPYAKEERLRCKCGAYHNAILIDYDTMRIAFLLQDNIDHFYVYSLQPGALTEENSNIQLTALLPGSKTRLITYYPDEDHDHRTCAIELILPDGSVYSTTQTPDHHWENGFLDLARTSEKLLFRVGDVHPDHE